MTIRDVLQGTKVFIWEWQGHCLGIDRGQFEEVETQKHSKAGGGLHYFERVVLD